MHIGHYAANEWINYSYDSVSWFYPWLECKLQRENCLLSGLPASLGTGAAPRKDERLRDCWVSGSKKWKAFKELFSVSLSLRQPILVSAVLWGLLASPLYRPKATILGQLLFFLTWLPHSVPPANYSPNLTPGPFHPGAHHQLLTMAFRSLCSSS